MPYELERNAYRLIVDERAKQLDCGFTDEHDDTHTDGEIACMAAFFAVPRPVYLAQGFTLDPDYLLPGILRLNRSTESNPGNVEARIRDLVKAGACIVAEIQRLQRVAGVNPEILED